MNDWPTGVRQLYDGLWDAESWQAGLNAVCAEMKAHHLISLAHPAGGTDADRPACWAVHISDQHVEAFLGHADELSTLLHASPLRRAMPTEAAVPLRILMRTELYRSAVRPMGGHHGAFALPFEQGFLAVCRPPTASDFTGAEIKRLQMLMPHFEATLRLKRRLLAIATHAAMLEEGLNQLDVGVLIVSRSGQLLYANQPAETALHEIHNGTGPPENAYRVREVIAKADGRRRMISRGPARRPIVLRAVPISSRGSGRLPVPSQESVAVFLRDPEQSVRTVGAELASGFGLTPREASLADLLARNLSLAEAADALGITLGNARIHLKRIFAKTNTRRQAELVSLILRLQV